jgi:hypothetical protein
MANQERPIDIVTALADARQPPLAAREPVKADEKTLGKESTEEAKQHLKEAIQMPEWSTLFMLLEKQDVFATRKHALSMVNNWTTEWQSRPFEDFKKLAEALSVNHLSDLPKKEELLDIQKSFNFHTDGLEDTEKIEVVRNAMKHLLNFGKLNTEMPKLTGRRLIALSVQNLDFDHMYEKSWLQELFGEKYNMTIHPYDPEKDTFPTDEPIVVIMRPYSKIWTTIFKAWAEKGIKYYVLHLSDEHSDDLIGFYQSSDCLGIVRTYYREEAEVLGEKVVTIPLGYHWSKGGGVDDPAHRTPRLPFREYTWCFLGTDWNGRPEKMKNLQLIQPHKLVWFKEWNDANMFGRDEYLNILLNSRFVPVPGGQNPETYRFYECLECGCIPVYVRENGDSAYIDKQVKKWIPLPDLPNWDSATAFIYQLMNNPPVMESFRLSCLMGWKAWKEDSKKKVRKVLNF